MKLESSNNLEWTPNSFDHKKLTNLVQLNDVAEEIAALNLQDSLPNQKKEILEIDEKLTAAENIITGIEIAKLKGEIKTTDIHTHFDERLKALQAQIRATKIWSLDTKPTIDLWPDYDAVVINREQPIATVDTQAQQWKVAWKVTQRFDRLGIHDRTA